MKKNILFILFSFLSLVVSAQNESYEYHHNAKWKDSSIITLVGYVEDGSIYNEHVDSISKETPLFLTSTEGLIIYYSDLISRKIEAEKGTIFVEVYPSSTKVFGMIYKGLNPEGNNTYKSIHYEVLEITKEQIIKFIPND